MFAAWQMGMVYFSGQTLSVDGRTPLPVNAGDYIGIITAGYLLSIIVMIFLPRIIVWTERITASVALLSALALFINTSQEFLAAALYVQFFCCCFMIGFETALIVGLFTEKTAAVHLTLAYGVANGLVAILQNDFYKIDFSVFRLFSAAALVMMLVFFFKLPGNVWPRSVKKADALVMPKQIFTGLLLWTCMGCFVTLFGNAVAEKFTHGVSVFYLSSAVSGIIIYLFLKRSAAYLRVFRIYMAIGAMGFVLSIASLFVPALSILTCVFLGVGSIGCWHNPLFGVLLARQYPSRFISPSIIGVAFLTVVVHSVVLDLFRTNTLEMYIVYLVIAVGMVILFMLLEPYLMYSFRGRTFKDIIGVVSEDSEPSVREQITDNKRQPLLKASVKTELAPPEDVPPHERRMKMLMTHSLEPLTRREYQLADCIMRGLRRAEIAQEMDILPETVTKYTNRIYDKFGIHRRQDLFKLAERLDKEEREKID
jgi:DNA-binding CsgD family transcriptional regulator